jgi:TPR repeat protein
MDRATAQRWFRAAAELGHGQAQLMLGRYLRDGVAGDPNPEEAREWLERAVAQGVADAQQDLAELSPPPPPSDAGQRWRTEDLAAPPG